MENNQNLTISGNRNNPHQEINIGSAEINTQDKKELSDALLAFQEALKGVNLPTTKAAIVNANITDTVEEIKKEKPDKQTLKTQLQNVFDAIKAGLGSDNAVSKWDLTKKILGIALKYGLKLIV
jgi:hypothetical protein